MQQYFGVGGKESESFFNSFSSEILQAALNVCYSLFVHVA